AIPHPRRPLPMIISEPFMVLGIAPNPIPFGGGFNNKTDVFFMVCSDSDFTHLQILARLGRILNHTGFLDQLRELEIPAEILELIRETEKKL
ncbi:MAG: PTS sugar transporter subunit IIA, partial [Thermoguttaceae bacterium]|nr:PTS sugar transporter subunit IIA [Thermoguttaceae bacterium]